jgi:hypothetical protein
MDENRAKLGCIAAGAVATIAVVVAAAIILSSSQARRFDRKQPQPPGRSLDDGNPPGVPSGAASKSPQPADQNAGVGNPPGVPSGAASKPLTARADHEGLKWNLEDVCDHLHNRGIRFTSRLGSETGPPTVMVFNRDGDGIVHIRHCANANEAAQAAERLEKGFHNYATKAWGRFVIHGNASPFYRQVAAQFP